MSNNQTPEQESAVKTMVIPVIVLVVICLVCSALLAVLNDLTAPIVEANSKAETLAAYVSVLPEGTTTDALTDIPVSTNGVEGAVKTADGAVAVKAAAAGYSGKNVTVYVAFDDAGAISNIVVDASTQTTGIGSKCGDAAWGEGFIGWSDGSVSNGSPVDAIGGATVSSNAAFSAINAAINCYNTEIKGVA